MIIKIDALDTLFFKDGKPFSLGEETWADGIFPPPPSAIYGALRSAYFGEHPEDFDKAGESNDPTLSLELKSFNYDFGNGEYYPMPLDYVQKKNDIEEKGCLLQLRESDFISSSKFDKILIPAFNEEVNSIENSLITLGSFERYLNGNEETVSFLSFNNIILPEPKVGIGRNNLTRSTEEGKLYRVGMRRLSNKLEFNRSSNNLSIIVEAEGIDLNEKGFMKLGAEGKVARYKKYEKKMKVPLNNEFGNDQNIFKVYLSTPAFFKEGNIPDLINHQNLKELKLELVSACIGKPILIGGFDMKNKTPKPMRKAVPAGSVYYLKSQKSFKEISDSINGNSISDYLGNEGYGISFVGKVNFVK